jgi:perosamine synthetase
MRREKAEYYNKKLSNIEGIKIISEKNDQFFVYQMYTIQLEDNKMRDKLQKHLTKSGIMTKIYFEPIHLKTFYKKNYSYKEGDLPITEDISKRVLTLPLYPSIKTSEIDYIVTEIKNSLG